MAFYSLVFDLIKASEIAMLQARKQISLINILLAKTVYAEHPYMTLSYPSRIFSLVLAATFGGYLLSSAVMIFIAAILPLSRADAVITSALLSFAVYTAAIIWVFAVKNAQRAWLGLLGATVIIGGLGLLLTEWLR